MASQIREPAQLDAEFDQTLAQRLARDLVPLPVALLYATDIAAALRELHQKGLSHGDLRTATVMVGRVGARLAPRVARMAPADLRADVTAFGGIVYEMVAGSPIPADKQAPAFTQIKAPQVLSDVRRDTIRLAEKCYEGWPDIKQVVIELRILGLQARRLASAQPRLKVVGQTVPHPKWLRQESGDRPALGVVPAHTIVCPRCGGHAPLFTPESWGEQLIGQFTPMRECERCRYRFFVIRIKRAK